MRAWSHHAIRHISKPYATCKAHGSVCYRTGVMVDGSFTFLRECEFSTFCSFNLEFYPMIFIYELLPYALTGCANMNFLC